MYTYTCQVHDTGVSLLNMAKPVRAASRAPHLPFKFVGGDPSIDLVNTVDWTSRGPESDRLVDYDRLTRWAEGAGVVRPRTAERLRALALERPHKAANAHEKAVRARWVLQQLFAAVVAGAPLEDALKRFNKLLATAYERLQLAPVDEADRVAGRQVRWHWRGGSEKLDAVLWPVLRAAAELLASNEAGHVRICGGADCGWLYVDRSRNGLRRWCQMETCGTREKSRRRARRVQESQ